MNQTVNLMDGVLLTKVDFKFDSHERVLAYLMDKLIDPKLSQKVEEIFYRYLDERKAEYHSILAFLVSKNSCFSPQTQNSHKLLQRKLQLLLKFTQDFEKYE